MKLLGTTASKLEKARSEISSAEEKLAELARQRDTAVAADEIEPVLAIDHQAEQTQRKLVVLRNKIGLLQDRLASEERDNAAARRAAAIATVEKMLPGRLEIVAEIEATIKGLPALFERLSRWQRDFITRYPAADVEFPYSHFLSDDRVLQNVMGALHAMRIEDASEMIAGLAAEEAQHHAGLIADLRQNPTPEIEEAA